MDLHSDRLYWPSTARRPRLSRTKGSKKGTSRRLSVDVLIIGAGVTGALLAFKLTAAGLRVALIDRRAVASGSTPASTALLQYEIDTPLLELRRRLGRAHADRAYLASLGAIHEMHRLAVELGADVELAPRPSLHLAVTRADAAGFRKEAAARAALGIPAAYLTPAALRKQFSLERPGAILSRDALEINPLKLTYHLLEEARRRGAVVLPRCDIDLSSLAAKSRPFRVNIPGGPRVAARHVAIATGYETPEQFHEIASLTELRSTYALATSPPSPPASPPAFSPTTARHEPWPQRALLWDAGDPYFYARTTADGRILIGGEDEPFTSARARDSKIAEKSARLMQKVHELLPGRRFRPAFRWAGTFAQTEDGLPYIGQHRKWTNVHFALGYGGNGITFSLLAAEIITASVLEQPHAAADLFRFDRASNPSSAGTNSSRKK